MQNGPALIDGSPAGASGRRFKPRVVPDPVGEGPDARCDVHLSLPARAENVVLVRHVIGGLAEALGLSPCTVQDVQLAVTEACTNVVRHAYTSEPGRLEVAAVTVDGALVLVVSDHGDGLHPRPHTDRPGLGLPLMAAVADEFSLDQPGSRGTRVRMAFHGGE